MNDLLTALATLRTSANAGALAVLGNADVTTAEEAAAIADLLSEKRAAFLTDPIVQGELLRSLIGLFQAVTSREAFEVLAERGLPELRAVFDLLTEGPIASPAGRNLLFLLKILAMYRDEDDLPRLAAAAQRPDLQDDYLWEVVFGAFDEEHPHREEFAERLRDPLPEGLAGVMYLDFVNTRSPDMQIDHPFDTPAGHAQLEALLTNADVKQNSFALSAAAALPFISEPPRSALLALALDHRCEQVQLKAAWAAGRIGSRAGIDLLARACLDPRVGIIAVRSLEDLNERNAIPARAKQPDFTALAEVQHWLTHPLEYGRPADSVEIYDSRDLYWPSTNDHRRLWLVKYAFHAADAGEADDVGVAMFGSITFALFGEVTAELSPEDIYALHCCWELEANEDPRAPAERSISAGRTLLREAGNAAF